MLKQLYDNKLTKNQKKVLGYIMDKAEKEHGLTVECIMTDFQEAMKFKSNKTLYNILNQLIKMNLISRLGDDFTLNPALFVFQKEAKSKSDVSLKYMLQELETERDIFPFLEPQNRLKYFQMVSQNREEASKIDYQLTRDICKLADAGVYEFPLQPIKGRPAVTVPFCVDVIATYDAEKTKTFKTYEDRELLQAIDYLKVNPEHYEEIAFECSDYENEYIRFLFNKYVL